jgi:hypothetical protein
MSMSTARQTPRSRAVATGASYWRCADCGGLAYGPSGAPVDCWLCHSRGLVELPQACDHKRMVRDRSSQSFWCALCGFSAPYTDFV